MRGLAKGARRERGNFSGGIDLLARGEIVAVVKLDRELQTLTHWTLLQMFRRPHDDLETNLYALSMAELIHRFLPVAVPHQELYDALHTSLEALERGGHEPRADMGDIPHARLAFDPKAGGIVDYATHPHGWRMRPATAMTLDHIARGEPADLCDPDAIDRANRLLAAFAREILGEELPALSLAIEPRRVRKQTRD